ncbi:MAG: hypothetical protein K9H63_02135 [Sphingobacteriaceae bacterium]|nr:hypothetical protein [Sphingobacteriaceae bacterium]
MNLLLTRASLFICCCFILVGASAKAQKKPKELIKNTFLTSIELDGLAKEWDQNQFTTDKVSGISYAFANNDSTLFVILKTANKESIAKMIHWGLSLGFNAIGQKKVQESIGFPAGKAQDKRFQPVLGRTKRPSIKEEVVQLNSIELRGFTNLIDGPIALKNDFGILASAQFNEAEELICEYALPMKLLQINPSKNDIFACQIKVNGLVLGASPAVVSRTAQPRGIPSGLTNTNSLLDSTEFWVFYPLASN